MDVFLVIPVLINRKKLFIWNIVQPHQRLVTRSIALPYFHKLLDVPGACTSFPSHSDETSEAGATVLRHRAKYFNDVTYRSNGRILRRRI